MAAAGGLAVVVLVVLAAEVTGVGLTKLDLQAQQILAAVVVAVTPQTITQTLRAVQVDLE
jgi:hypothetical protein